MKVYDPHSLRNVAFVGHSGAGKTQLLSTLLFDAGAVNRLGRVDDGTSVTDYDDEAIARKHTLAASLACAEWNKIKINLIDTPGIANFLSDARAALRVADAAMVVVDAVAGAEVSTEKMWAAAEELGLPRLIVLNRLDRERASLERSVESLRAVFGRTVVPIQLPVGEEKAFRGVVDLVSMKAWVPAPDAGGKAAESDVPADLATAAQQAREALIEMVAEADDSLMETILRRRHAHAGGTGVGPAARRRRRPHLSGAVCLRHRQHRHPAAPRRHRGVRGAARRTPVQRQGHRRTAGRHRHGCRQRAGGGVRLEDGGRPVRGTHHPVPRRVGRAEVRFDPAQRDPRHPRTARSPRAAPGQDADQRPRDQGGRPGRRGEAEGDADQRPAGGQEHRPAHSAHRVPRAGDLVRDRAEDPRRRGQDQHLAAPAAGRGSEHQLHARSRRPRNC